MNRFIALFVAIFMITGCSIFEEKTKNELLSEINKEIEEKPSASGVDKVKKGALISAEKRSRAEYLTQELTLLLGDYQNAPVNEKSTLIKNIQHITEERRQLLIEILDQDPLGILQMSPNQQLLKQIPEAVQKLIEQKRELEGELKVLFVDYKDPTKNHIQYYLKTDSGKRFALHFAKQPPRLMSGTRVRAHGVLFEEINSEDFDESNGVMALKSGQSSILTLEAGGTGSSSGTAVSTPLPNTLGEQRTLVLLVNFQEAPSNQPWTINQARSLVFETVNNFYLENSFGQTWFNGDVYGWYTVGFDSINCDPTELARQADLAVSATGINTLSYDRIVYVHPNTSSCTWAGMGTVGGNPSQAWINGEFSLYIVGHELGHNFGILHAQGLECGNSILGTGCQTNPYGDTLDIMGQRPSHLSSFHKEKLGWLDTNQINEILDDGTYYLAPYLTEGSLNPNSLKILKDTDPVTGQKTWYYLEFRQATGFDSWLGNESVWYDNNNILNGVVFHTGKEEDASSSFLLDMTPESAGNFDWFDPALVTGQTFSDVESGVTVYTDFTDPDGAIITVSLSAQSCIRALPEIIVTPSDSGLVTPTTPVNYTITLTNHDIDECGPSLFNLTENASDLWGATFVDPTVTLAPGTSTTTILELISTASTPDGIYTINVTFTNDAAPTYLVSNSATYSVGVESNNSAPLPVADNATTLQGSPVTIDVLANDSDPDGDELSIYTATSGAKGDVTLNGDDTITYSPYKKSKGLDSFSYIITDGTTQASTVVNVNIESSQGQKGGGGKGKGSK